MPFYYILFYCSFVGMKNILIVLAYIIVICFALIEAIDNGNANPFILIVVIVVTVIIRNVVIKLKNKV